MTSIWTMNWLGAPDAAGHVPILHGETQYQRGVQQMRGRARSAMTSALHEIPLVAAVAVYDDTGKEVLRITRADVTDA